MIVDEFETLRVYELDPRLKHPTIFQWFDALPPAGSFIIENDHDPLPLYYELKAERADQFAAFDYLQKGPEIWRVRIGKSKVREMSTETTLYSSCSVAANKSQSENNVQESFAVCSIDPTTTVAKQENLLDVSKLEPKKKHPTIFAWFEALQPGESFRIHNDHDPKPLYYQMLGQFGPIFEWTYIEKGPTTWTITIHKKQPDDPTIGQIAATDMRKAAAMKKLGIDFCCGGGKSLKQAADDAGITVEALRQVLAETEQTFPTASFAFNRWDADFLTDYIYNQHHKYFYENGDDIWQLLTKVRDRHGRTHPELLKLAEHVDLLFGELQVHFTREERVLFPYIKELALWKREGKIPVTQLQMTKGPLAMMHSEHDAAGDILRSIRGITNEYQAPPDSCNSFKLLYFKLQELEQDLHQHIHLENNVLFPKALELEKELGS